MRTLVVRAEADREPLVTLTQDHTGIIVSTCTNEHIRALFDRVLYNDMIEVTLGFPPDHYEAKQTAPGAMVLLALYAEKMGLVTDIDP